MTIFDDLFSLQGKTVLVTGGATGIGRMIATALVQAGASAMIASRKGEDCERAADEINALNELGKAQGFAADVGNEEGVAALVSEVNSRTDRLDILINNAGVTWGQPLEEFPHFAWGKIMDVNVAGLFQLTRDLLPLLGKSAAKDDPSRVINLGSIMGISPIGDGAYSYSASKAAVHHLTKILARELAERQITVNAIAPGPFQSRMTAFATATDEQANQVGSLIPLGRIGKPEDISAATLYLCGKGGSYVTGAILPIDGGMHVSGQREVFGELD